MNKEISEFTQALALQVADFEIYQRGKDYFQHGRVGRVTTVRDKTTAIVHGTDDYTVSLFFDEEDELVFECTCPFEGENACKHTVAVILFLSETKFNRVSKEKEVKNYQDLVTKLTLSEAQQFIIKILDTNPNLYDDLKVFTQGQKESSTTENDYYKKFVKELTQINPAQLLESFYRYDEQSDYGDDYWDNDSGGYDDDNELSLWVDETVELATKYIKNNNFGEALKIYISALQAFTEIGHNIETKHPDLGDWTDRCTHTLVESLSNFISILPLVYISVAISNLLNLIKIQTLKSNKSQLITLLGDLYYKAEDWTLLTNLVNKYMKFYPPVSLKLLLHYQSTGDKKSLCLLAEQLLPLTKNNENNFFSFKPENYFDKEEFEINIRRLLTATYSPITEYEIYIKNYERLFVLTRDLGDYKILREKYQSSQEKQLFIQTIKIKFIKDSDIAAVFKVFQIENYQDMILDLIQKHQETECFSKMIDFVKNKYPEKCFNAYKSKIDKLSVVADTDKYESIAKHLLKMKQIELSGKFQPYVDEIKQKYYRRYRLMEELDKYKL